MKKSIGLLLIIIFTNNLLLKSQNNTDYLNDSINKIIQDKSIPGMNVAIFSKDSMLWKSCHGLADIAQKEEVTSEHLFAIGSVTKTFTALAIMTLVGQGKLNLEDNLSDIAPEVHFKNKWEATHPVKIKHLLEHKAGFDDMHFSAFNSKRFEGMTAFDELKIYEKSCKSRWKPGLVHSYSNPGYVILGYLIEKTSGMSYQDYMKTEVIEPIGMKSTIFPSQVSSQVQSKMAKGYHAVDGEIVLVENKLSVGEAVGGLLSNQEDMIRFVQFLMNEEIQEKVGIINSALILEMEKVHSWFESENNITIGYGLGLDNTDFDFEHIYFIGHSGGVKGYSAHIIYNKELDIGLSVANNKLTSNRKVMNLLLSHFISDRIDTIGSNKIESNGKEVTKEWNGTYYPVNERNGIYTFLNGPLNTIKLKALGDSLIVKYHGSSESKLIQYDDNAFIETGESLPGVFLTKTDNRKSFYYYGTYYKQVSPISLTIFRWSLFLGIILGLLTFLSAIIQGIISIFKPTWKLYFKYSMMLSLPVIVLLTSIVILVFNSSLSGIESLGRIGLRSIVIFVLTTLAPILLLLSALYLFKMKRHISSALMKVIYLLTFLFSAFFITYCITNGWFAIRLWAY